MEKRRGVGEERRRRVEEEEVGRKRLGEDEW